MAFGNVKLAKRNSGKKISFESMQTSMSMVFPILVFIAMRDSQLGLGAISTNRTSTEILLKRKEQQRTNMLILIPKQERKSMTKR